MTKINKLGKSTFVIAILSFILVAVLAFGGTYAYFSAQSQTVSGTLTMGNLTIGDVNGVNSVKDATTLVFDGKLAQPNQIIMNDTLSATVTTNIAYYTRVKFSVEIEVAKTGENYHTHIGGEDCGDILTSAIEALIICDGDVETANAGWKKGTKTENIDSATKAVSSAYYYQLAPTLADADNTKEEFAVKIQVNSILGKNDGTANGCTYWQDATIKISVSFEVIQADYLVDGTTVATTGFTTGGEAETAWEKALTGVQSGTGA